MDKLKLYCFFTPSHEELYENWLKPTAEKEYELCPVKLVKQISKSGSYKEKGWRETQYNKVLAWIDAIKENMGDVIVCADTDVQLLRPSSIFLVESLAKDDICLSAKRRKGQDMLWFLCVQDVLSKLKISWR